MNGLKKRLDNAKGRWVEELPHVLWRYQTTPRRSTGETPFSMTYRVETVIPIETGFPTLKTSLFSPSSNNELLENSLDFIEECNSPIGILPTQTQARLWCQSKVEATSAWWLGNEESSGHCKNPAWGKLGPNWEGLYRITSVASIRAYFLEDLDEHVIPRPWNVNNLKMYYY